jgi:hypothetical protein
VRDLEQFLAQLAPDVTGVGHGGSMVAGSGSVPSDGGGGARAPQSPLPFLDSRMPAPPPRPVDSSVVDAKKLSFLTSDQVSHLVNSAGPDFAAKGYGQAAVNKKVDGNFILKANEVELSLLFSQMGVDAVDMPTLREAVASWKVDPAQAFVTEQRGKVETARRASEAEVRSGFLLQTPDSTSQTPNPQPRTTKPKPQLPIQNLKPLNPKPQTTKPKTRNPKAIIPNSYP